MNPFRFALLSFWLLCASLTHAQEEREQVTLSLEESIEIALENNIELQRQKNNLFISESNRKQAVLNFLPNLNASLNYNLTFGNNWDNFAGRYVSETTKSSRPYVYSNFTVFNGFFNQNHLKQMKVEESQAEEAIEAEAINVKSDVITFYLNAAIDKENIKIVENRLELLEEQLDRANKRFKLGLENKQQVYNLQSQIANEKLRLTNQQNQFRSDLLLLFQSLQLEELVIIDVQEIEIPELEITAELPPYETVLERSLAYSPDIQRSQFGKESSLYRLKKAQSAKYPIISVGAGLGSFYSSNGAFDPETGNFSDDVPFFDQLQFNQQQNLNLQLDIPIFTRGVNNNNIQVARINAENAQLDVKQTQMQVTNQVQQAYLDLVAARTSFIAARENEKALEQAYEFARKSWETGNGDFFSYLESLNNKNQAEIETVIARYTFALRKKILEIYQGLD